MLKSFMERPLMTLGLLAGGGAIIVAGTVGVLLSDDISDEVPKEQYASVSTEGPFITIESADLNGDVGRAHPVRIRVEDSQGMEVLEVRLGNEVVWSPQILAGQKIVYTTYPWIPDATGDYQFEIIARTIDGREQTKDVILSAGCCPPTGEVNIGYTVQAGDDPASIAANFGVCLDELIESNPGLEDIAPGDVLEIPYRPDAEGTAGIIEADECDPAPAGFFNNPEILQDIPRRDTAYPIAGGTISRGFGCAEFYTGYRGTDCPDNMPWFHTGLDISVNEGSPITTVDSGVVTHAGPDVTSNADCSRVGGSDAPHNGYGRHMRIEQGEYLFLYAHLVAVAQGVNVGTVFDGSGLLLGYVGSTGCSTGPHLHLEVRRNGIPLDPLIYINQTNQ